ncbi:MAG: hypothetical protein PW734_02205 [Verrucomicrobium sp.]|nr:hypothetical protein [Verrucomicrobium sp.]
MVHHLSLLHTKPGVDGPGLESMMVETRIRLLKIPEITNLHVGKRIDKENPATLFFSFDVDNMEKLRLVKDSAIFIQFQRQVLEPNVDRADGRDYEMEPGKDVTYS